MSGTGPDGEGGGPSDRIASSGAASDTAAEPDGAPGAGGEPRADAGTGSDADEVREGGLPASEDHRYFRAIETRFIELRGAPLLLSNDEWQITRRWHRRGIPLEHVFRMLEEISAKRGERDDREGLHTLRYYAKAIEASWEAVEELRAGGQRTAAPSLDLGARLAALAEALPPGTPDRAAVAERVAGLCGDTEHVEQALAALDRELLAAAERDLSEADRTAVEAQLDETVTGLFGSLFAGDVDRARERLRRQVLRRRLGLPVLSLFSPEAEAGDRPEEDASAET